MKQKPALCNFAVITPALKTTFISPSFFKNLYKLPSPIYSSIILFLLMVITAFLGYVLP